MPNSDQQRSAFEVGVGAVSPLWPAFAFAASAGAAYWWISRMGYGQWRPVFAHLEAMLEAPVVVSETVLAVVEPEVEPAQAAAVEAVETTADAVTETAAAVAELPVKAADVASEVVEAAPIVEAAPAPEAEPKDEPLAAKPKAAAAAKPAATRAPAVKRSPAKSKPAATK